MHKIKKKKSIEIMSVLVVLFLLCDLSNVCTVLCVSTGT